MGNNSTKAKKAAKKALKSAEKATKSASKAIKNANKATKSANNAKSKAEDALALVEQRPINKKLIITISAIVAALAIVLSTVFGILYSVYNTRFDYLNGNISKYIRLDRSDYAGYDINVTVTEPTALELEERILQILADNKSKTPLYNGFYVTPKVPLQNGWVVDIWYRGYTYDEDGNEVEFDGGCNFTSSTAATLELGSGDFVSGFEIGLIGKNITEYSKFTVTSAGVVDEQDIVVVTMLAMFPDGSSETYKQKRIDLSASNVDEVWGEGFKEALVGKTIGQTLEDSIISEMENGTAVYTDVKISSTVRPTMPHTDGNYSNGDRVTVEYTVTQSDGESKTEKTSFTLNEYVIGGNFGGEVRELMYTLLGGGEIGVAKNASYTDNKGVEYSSPKVVSVERREDKPIVVETYFPYDYSEESLRGKTAYFDVYVVGAIIYETPELTESFITDTLKLDEQSLENYDGDGIVEKYRAKIQAELYSEYEKKLEAQIEELVWAHLSQKVVCDDNKLPIGEVRAVKAEYTNAFMEYYDYYKSLYGSIEEAAMDFFGISNGSLWEEYVDALARDDIVQKMVVYYIGRQENFLPDVETLETMYTEKVESLLSEYLVEKKCKRDDFDTEQEYLAKVEEHRANMILEYGEESIFDALCYEIVVPAATTLANVKKP